MARKTDRNPKGPELSPDIALELLKDQNAKGTQFVQTQQFDEASVDAWRNQTVHILKQAFGEESFMHYAGAFWNWQTHAITSDDEYEVEMERLADVTRAFPRAMSSVTAAIETLEKVAALYESIVTAGVFRASCIKVAEAAKVALPIRSSVRSQILFCRCNRRRNWQDQERKC